MTSDVGPLTGDVICSKTLIEVLAIASFVRSSIINGKMLVAMRAIEPDVHATVFNHKALCDVKRAGFYLFAYPTLIDGCANLMVSEKAKTEKIHSN